MSIDFNIFDIDWAKKGHGGLSVSGTDVYISLSTRTDRNAVYISFRNNKLPKNIEYLTMARFGDLLLFREADKAQGWKLNEAGSLMTARNIHPSIRQVPNDILDLIKKHNHEGFDLHFDAKSKIYYIDTTKAVEG